MFSIEVNENKPRFLACSEVIDGGRLDPHACEVKIGITTLIWG